MAIVILIVVGIAMFYFAAFILKSVSDVKDTVDPNTKMNSSVPTNESYGEPMAGDNKEELEKKIESNNTQIAISG